MPESKSLGLYGKYKVERIDGKPIKAGCIVLEWDDKNGREGIRAFSAAVRKDGHRVLADDLDIRLKAWDEKDESTNTKTGL